MWVSKESYTKLATRNRALLAKTDRLSAEVATLKDWIQKCSSIA